MFTMLFIDFLTARCKHWNIFEVKDTDIQNKTVVEKSTTKSLAIGRARTPELPSEHLGRLEQVHLVAAGVLRAMAEAGISNIEDVHYVQVKCPLLTLERYKCMIV
jgi:cyanuric acid amidohydrolase